MALVAVAAVILLVAPPDPLFPALGAVPLVAIIVVLTRVVG